MRVMGKLQRHFQAEGGIGRSAVHEGGEVPVMRGRPGLGLLGVGHTQGTVCLGEM